MGVSTTRQRISKKAQTVLGMIDAEELGITLPHEHFLLDMSVWFVEPKEPGLKALAHQPPSSQNLSWLRNNPFSSLNNVQLLDEQLAIDEAMLFKKEGGSTIVDLTNAGMRRDPLSLVRISNATGLNVIMGSGYYVGDAQSPDYDAKSEEEIAEETIADMEVGVANTGVRAGIIGEIGCSWPLQEREKKSLRAAARAQRRTGAAINIHPGRHEKAPMESMRILDHAGADLSRVVMSHVDRTGFTLETRRELARTGCYLEYDQFGGFPFYPLHMGVFRAPCDRERIEQIIELIEQGYQKQILVSNDISTKIQLVHYGGDGYTHILRNILPQMLARGISRDEIHTMLVDNPKRMLALAFREHLGN